MSEPSVEAVVAGQAAEAAVQEVQAREEIANAAEAAAVESVVAASIAEDAQETAALAAEVSFQSADVAGEAAQSAAEAREMAETAASLSGAALSDNETLRSEVADLKGMVALLLNREAEAQEAQSNGVEEVAVDAGAGDPDSNTGDTTASEAPSGTAGATERRRLRRRSGR